MFSSGGCANVPEFSCICKEEDEEAIYNFLAEELPALAPGIVFARCTQDSLMFEETHLFSSKGVFYYDAAKDQIINRNLTQKEKESYALVAVLRKAVTVDSFPEHIRVLFADHLIDAVFGEDKIVHVKHAF